MEIKMFKLTSLLVYLILLQFIFGMPLKDQEIDNLINKLHGLKQKNHFIGVLSKSSGNDRDDHFNQDVNSYLYNNNDGIILDQDDRYNNDNDNENYYYYKNNNNGRIFVDKWNNNDDDDDDDDDSEHLLRSLDSLGGGYLLKKRNLDSLGGGYLLRRSLDLPGLSNGGSNLLKRQIDPLGGAQLLKRSMDPLGGAHLLKRSVDPLGGEGQQQSLNHIEPADAAIDNYSINHKGTLNRLINDKLHHQSMKIIHPYDDDELHFNEIDNTSTKLLAGAGGPTSKLFLYKRNFDEIDLSPLNDFELQKKFEQSSSPTNVLRGSSYYYNKRNNFDEIDNSALGSSGAGLTGWLNKRNFDEIDRSPLGGGDFGFRKKNYYHHQNNLQTFSNNNNKSPAMMNGGGFSTLHYFKRNFDEIDNSGLNGFLTNKRNFDEIDNSGLNGFLTNKRNFDEIDRSPLTNGPGAFLNSQYYKRNFDEIDNSPINGFFSGMNRGG